MSNSEIRNIIEAALLAAGKSLSLSELSLLFDETQRPEPAAIRAAIEALAQDYVARPIEIQETGGGFRVQVRRQYAGTVSRLWPERPQRYSRALLETLALIAYRQPITRAEVQAARRGGESEHHQDAARAAVDPGRGPSRSARTTGTARHHARFPRVLQPQEPR